MARALGPIFWFRLFSGTVKVSVRHLEMVPGVRQGATENAAVCTALIEDLRERGLDTSQPTLLVLTVIRLGVPELLRRTLATTNPIESAFSVTQNVTRRVKRWREGDMRQRWCVAGLMRAENKFHRVKGYRHMSHLLKALDRMVLGKGLDEDRKIA